MSLGWEAERREEPPDEVRGVPILSASLHLFRFKRVMQQQKKEDKRQLFCVIFLSYLTHCCLLSEMLVVKQHDHMLAGLHLLSVHIPQR